jgi:hypothetical protein
VKEAHPEIKQMLTKSNAIKQNLGNDFMRVSCGVT